MALPSFFPEQFKSPEIPPAMAAALDDVYGMKQNDKYTTVGLVWANNEDVTIGTHAPQSALLLCAEPTGGMSLNSVSVDDTPTEDLARVAYDLVEPIPSQMLLDLGSLLHRSVEGEYRALAGVLTHQIPEKNAAFGLLVVPSIFRFAGYDMLDMTAPENAKYVDMSREDVSRAIAVAVLEFAISHSIQV